MVWTSSELHSSHWAVVQDKTGWTGILACDTPPHPPQVKGKCLTYLHRGWARACSRNQPTWDTGGRSDSLWEVYGKQPLHWLRSSWSSAKVRRQWVRSSSSYIIGQGVFQRSLCHLIQFHRIRNDIQIIYGLIFGKEQKQKLHIKVLGGR